ncbi:enoyl-CoA hydratase/isomerase family protein [Microbulbifer hydrolyticus]|uniref:3-hydroxyisobutyryl-CoA hydrolase n=1 Tax=Microbulbifer hydrolyticus TaxID=48074 RepID=A0AA89PUD4_9GAMM|nr:enoyl-CoA hydratase/isomerase family protein [Microbulbifer hydrolyticus]MBB5211052.1 enoyl-CoA hydratase/carnithine racemase [Microbulbifer hydrolyticus]
MPQESPLIVERQGPVGKLTLNLPKAHNALNLEMIDLMAAQLDEWEADDSIACIWIEGAGDKALCAGGDVVALHKASGSYTECGRLFLNALGSKPAGRPEIAGSLSFRYKKGRYLCRGTAQRATMQSIIRDRAP